MHPALSKSEQAEEELEAYLSAKCREIANKAHCELCTREGKNCKEKIRTTATRIHSLVSEMYAYRSGSEEVPAIGDE